MNIESIKDAGNDLDMEVLLWVTLLCIVSNNSHTKIGKLARFRMDLGRIM